MTEQTNSVPGEQPASPQVAAQQQAATDWPKPGEEGYVHPDGTPQSVQQLADNRRAAADRAAAGSAVHGAPAATPGPQVHEQAEAARKRADQYAGPTTEDRDQAVTESIAGGPAEQPDAAERDGDQRKATPPRSSRSTR